MAIHYVMEDPREADRLADKVDAEAWVASYLAPRLQQGMRVLDVGTGPGTIAAAVARGHPSVEIVALDGSSARIAIARENLRPYRNGTVAVGDAQQLPFNDDSFDLVYARFLLEYLPDKRRAVDEFARVTRPGGTIILQDLDGQLVNHYPPDPDLERSLAKALNLLATTGFDPFVGRRLFELLLQAGLVKAELQIEPYHQIIGRATPHERSLWEAKLDIVEKVLEQLGFDGVKQTKARFLAYLDRADTITFSQLFTCYALKPW